MRRRIYSYDEGQGWEAINLISSIGAFFMAIGFGLVIVDVAMNAVVAVRGSRNPWKAGTLEWAMPTPAPAYNFASLPRISSREPLRDDPDLPNRIARGEGYLGMPRGRRETLTVAVASGEPDHLVVFPDNTALPILMAAVTGGAFFGMLAKAYWLVPIAALVVAALATRWAWTLGSRSDAGAVDVGHGLALRPAAEAAEPPGWWGSTFLLLANAVFFGSLLFGYAFLWTIAPNWPPPSYLAPDPLGLGLAAVGAALAPLGLRLVESRAAGRRSPYAGLAITLAGGAAVVAAAVIPLSHRPDPTAHAYDATLWLVACYVLFHASLLVWMTLFLVARRARGFNAQQRLGEIRIVRLWADYLALATILGLGALYLPGALS